MYNVERVLNSLFSRVGWRQPTQPEYAILTEPNITTKSGRYFQDTHAAVSIQNIKDCQLDADISDSDFNLMLEDLQKGVILEMLSAIFTTREVVDTIQTYDREPDIADTLIANQNKFVGYRIDIGKSSDFVVALTQVGLYFNADATFELKCFVDNKLQPIWTKEVTAIGGEVTIVDVSDLVLSYMSDKTRSRTFYIGYFQQDLGYAQAWDEEVNVYNCGQLWRADTFESEPTVDGVKFQTPVTYSSLNYGLNLQFTSYRDYTNLIVANTPLFDTAIGLQMAAKVLELILTSTRSNSVQRMTNEMLGDIYRDLNTEGPTEQKPYAPGIKARFLGEILKLQKSFFGVPKIESHSLPYAVYQDYKYGR